MKFTFSKIGPGLLHNRKNHKSVFIVVCMWFLFISIQCYRYLNNCCYEVPPYIIHLNRLYSNLLDFRKNSNVRHWTQSRGDTSVKGLYRISVEFLTGLVYFEYWETGWGKNVTNDSLKWFTKGFLVTSTALFSLFGK